MITQIGLVAGDIWNHLDLNNSKDSLDNIVKVLGKNKDMVLMSIGWLAREGHVVLEGDKSNYVIKLTENDS